MRRFFAFGVKRSPKWFFFEIDNKKRHFYEDIIEWNNKSPYKIHNFRIFETKNGFHLHIFSIFMPYIYDELWAFFKKKYKTDYKKKGKRQQPNVIRISEKILGNGKIISPRPELLYEHGHCPDFNIDDLVFYRGYVK